MHSETDPNLITPKKRPVKVKFCGAWNAREARSASVHVKEAGHHRRSLGNGQYEPVLALHILHSLR